MRNNNGKVEAGLSMATVKVWIAKAMMTLAAMSSTTKPLV
jgi:hypothetical protein